MIDKRSNPSSNSRRQTKQARHSRSGGEKRDTASTTRSGPSGQSNLFRTLEALRSGKLPSKDVSTVPKLLLDAIGTHCGKDPSVVAVAAEAILDHASPAAVPNLPPQLSRIIREALRVPGRAEIILGAIQTMQYRGSSVRAPWRVSNNSAASQKTSTNAMCACWGVIRAAISTGLSKNALLSIVRGCLAVVNDPGELFAPKPTTTGATAIKNKKTKPVATKPKTTKPKATKLKATKSKATDTNSAPQEGIFQKASGEVLARRKIYRAKRPSQRAAAAPLPPPVAPPHVALPPLPPPDPNESNRKVLLRVLEVLRAALSSVEVSLEELFSEQLPVQQILSGSTGLVHKAVKAANLPSSSSSSPASGAEDVDHTVAIGSNTEATIDAWALAILEASLGVVATCARRGWFRGTDFERLVPFCQVSLTVVQLAELTGTMEGKRKHCSSVISHVVELIGAEDKVAGLWLKHTFGMGSSSHDAVTNPEPPAPNHTAPLPPLEDSLFRDVGNHDDEDDEQERRLYQNIALTTAMEGIHPPNETLERSVPRIPRNSSDSDNNADMPPLLHHSTNVGSRDVFFGSSDESSESSDSEDDGEIQGASTTASGGDNPPVVMIRVAEPQPSSSE